MDLVLPQRSFPRSSVLCVHLRARGRSRVPPCVRRGAGKAWPHCGVLPLPILGLARAAWSRGRARGRELADRFGVIAAERLDLAPDQLLRLARLNSLTYSFLPKEQLRHGFPGQRAVTGQHVVLSGDEKSYWAELKSKSRKFASNVERNERLLAKELGPLKMTLHTDPARELQRLIDVKAAQYLRTEGVNPLKVRWKTDLFRELLGSPEPQCAAVLSTLYAGETWLASHLGVTSPTVFHYWYPVYNPNYARFSPGHVLTKYLLLGALSAGARYFDMAGFGLYKDHFRPKSYEYHSGILALSWLRRLAQPNCPVAGMARRACHGKAQKASCPAGQSSESPRARLQYSQQSKFRLPLTLRAGAYRQIRARSW